MINDSTRPLLLIGSNPALFFLQALCNQHNIKIAGIIDSDHFGNTQKLEDIPVVDSEVCFKYSDTLEHYKNNYNFFLAQEHNNKNSAKKRKRLMQLIDHYQLPCISLKDHSAWVHPSTQIGKNVLIDALVYISAKNTIGDYTSFYAASMVSYHNEIGRNAVFQRRAGVMNYNTIGDDVFVGVHSQICGDNLTVATGTVIDPCMTVKRSTKDHELIGLSGKDLRKVYTYFTIEE